MFAASIIQFDWCSWERDFLKFHIEQVNHQFSVPQQIGFAEQNFANFSNLKASDNRRSKCRIAQGLIDFTAIPVVVDLLQ